MLPASLLESSLPLLLLLSWPRLDAGPESGTADRPVELVEEAILAADDPCQPGREMMEADGLDG